MLHWLLWLLNRNYRPEWSLKKYINTLLILAIVRIFVLTFLYRLLVFPLLDQQAYPYLHQAYRALLIYIALEVAALFMEIWMAAKAKGA